MWAWVWVVGKCYVVLTSVLLSMCELYILGLSQLDYSFCDQATSFDMRLVYVARAVIFTFTSKLCCLRITMLCFVLLLNRWRG